MLSNKITRERKRNRQTDGDRGRDTDRQTNTKTGTQADTQIGAKKETEAQTETYRQTERQDGKGGHCPNVDSNSHFLDFQSRVLTSRLDYTSLSASTVYSLGLCVKRI